MPAGLTESPRRARNFAARQPVSRNGKSYTMKALALVPGSTNLRLVDRPEPAVNRPDEVKLRVLRVGICGTDREEAKGGRARAPDGHEDLVIGHEMLGQVVDVGGDVTSVKAGDHALFTVRRGCGKCLPCAMNRSDMCRTGEYRERGIWGLDGYEAESVVDTETYLVPVPAEIAGIGVLLEPLSVVEKAIDEAVRVQAARLPDAAADPDWLSGKKCLVAGLGPIGLLASLVLRLRGAEVYGLGDEDEDTVKPGWLTGIGGHYVDDRKVPADKLAGSVGAMDLIVEGIGVPRLILDLLDALALNGIYAMTSVPGGEGDVQIAAGELVRRLVLQNQVVAGSVNASRGHFQMAVRDLVNAHLRWGDHVAGLITHRYHFTDFAAAMEKHGHDEMKAVVEWASPG
jgi:threonine dehydrogenase-like Zn-dependent dehydrogenase